MLACECAAWYAGQGMTLLDAMNALYERFGFYRSGLMSRAFEGQDGMAAMGALMEGLRTAPPAEIAGQRVEAFTDYLREGTGLIPADVLEFRLAGEGKVIVRPSGTEPKLKLYLSVRGRTEEEAAGALAALEEAAGALMDRRSR